MIDSYGFGWIIIDGKRYTRDVVLFPDRVKSSWSRLEGHRLHVRDLEEIIPEKPEILIIGTGYFGFLKVPPETKEYLRLKGIKLITQKTKKACETYNRLTKTRRTVAALHLTC